MNAHNLSILHILAPGRVGGLEKVVRTLAVGHQRQGLSVHVVPVVQPKKDLHEFEAPLRAAGVRVSTIEIPARAYLRERRLVRGLIQDIRPDLVHTHGYRSDVLHVGLAHANGIPAVTTMHGADRQGGRTRISEWVQFKSFRRFDAVIAVSRKMADDLEHRWVTPERLHLIPNAWDGARPRYDRLAARNLLELPQDGVVVGWVGRLIPAKGCDVFLRAMARNREKCAVSILGDGPELPNLRRLASSIGLENRLRFHGTVPNAGDLLPAFDLVVLSSRHEGTPIVLFEAMAARVPIVATEVGGIPDVVRPGREALIVPPDNVEELASAINEALRDHDGSGKRVLSAQQRLTSRYDTNTWLRSYAQLYQHVATRD